MKFHVKYLRMHSFFYTGDYLNILTSTITMLDKDQYPSGIGQIFTIYPSSVSTTNATPEKCTSVLNYSGTDYTVLKFPEGINRYGYRYSDGTWILNGSWYTKGFMHSGYNPSVFSKEIATVYKNSLNNNATWSNSDFLGSFSNNITDLNLVVCSGSINDYDFSGWAYVVSYVYPGNDPNADEIIVI